MIDLGTGRRWYVEALDDAFVHEEPSELENIIEAQFETMVRAKVDALPRDAREILHLRFERDLSYAEIAAILGLASEDAARMRVNRVIERLRDELSDAAREAAPTCCEEAMRGRPGSRPGGPFFARYETHRAKPLLHGRLRRGRDGSWFARHLERRTRLHDRTRILRVRDFLARSVVTLPPALTRAPTGNRVRGPSPREVPHDWLRSYHAV